MQVDLYNGHKTVVVVVVLAVPLWRIKFVVKLTYIADDYAGDYYYCLSAWHASH